MDKVNILDVLVDNLSLQEVLEKAAKFFVSEHQHYIVTPNPEFIVAAQDDKQFRDILNYADIAVADGIGLLKAARFFGRTVQRVTGVDLVWALCELAEQKNCSVFFLGGAETIAAEAAGVIKKYFPNLIVAGTESGGVINDPFVIDETLLTAINSTAPTILFVAFGHVKQEKWIFSHLDKLPSVKLAVGVGGAFNYISGHMVRAPQWIRSLGLEWVFRLVREPWRWRRIVDAIIIFPFLVIKKKLSR